MFSRFIFKPSNLKLAAVLCIRESKPISADVLNFDLNLRFFPRASHFYSTNHNGNHNNGDDPSNLWKSSFETEIASGSLFEDEDTDSFQEFQNPKQMKSAPEIRSSSVNKSWDNGFDVEDKGGDKNADGWITAEGFKSWTLEMEEKKDQETLFDVERGEGDEEFTLKDLSEAEKIERSDIELKQLESEEKVLSAVVKGPDRAFGDLIAASQITDEMLDTLIALKNFEGIKGLPPLTEIEDQRYEKTLKNFSRAEIERQKQEEIAKGRVRQVDEKGRAYGTGRRKCSIARVWVQPGGGKFKVNDKEFDVYFPMLDHRATLLRPFSETMTLGKWDVDCTVKGGGVSGQVGAIRLGISRALEKWAPDLRPPLRQAGFLTRDPRVVERKKPGKAKARKSFQWVKR